jgi:hypothetical protein
MCFASFVVCALLEQFLGHPTEQRLLHHLDRGLSPVRRGNEQALQELIALL